VPLEVLPVPEPEVPAEVAVGVDVALLEVQAARATTATRATIKDRARPSGIRGMGLSCPTRAQHAARVTTR
jgi:hypothetical protein